FFLLALLPIAWCFVDADRQSLYDRLSGTRLVVSDPKTSQNLSHTTQIDEKTGHIGVKTE
ncbi:MAG: hypothetical protein ACO37Z_01580, partial [Burkholderiaceae bacterium]